MKNLDTGAVVADRVGVAATRAERAVGLLNRGGLEPGEGLWIVPSRGVHTFWMRFAIDIIALDDHGVVIDRVVNLKPWRLRLPRRGTAGVLELPVGTLDRSGTQLGHRIEFEAAAVRAASSPAPAAGYVPSVTPQAGGSPSTGVTHAVAVTQAAGTSYAGAPRATATTRRPPLVMTAVCHDIEELR